MYIIDACVSCVYVCVYIESVMWLDRPYIRYNAWTRCCSLEDEQTTLVRQDCGFWRDIGALLRERTYTNTSYSCGARDYVAKINAFNTYEQHSAHYCILLLSRPARNIWPDRRLYLCEMVTFVVDGFVYVPPPHSNAVDDASRSPLSVCYSLEISHTLCDAQLSHGAPLYIYMVVYRFIESRGYRIWQ